MTPQNREAAEACMMKRLAIICSKGTLDMAYPGLVLALAAIGLFLAVSLWEYT